MRHTRMLSVGAAALLFLAGCTPFTPLILSDPPQPPPYIEEVQFVSESSLVVRFDAAVEASSWYMETIDEASHALDVEVRENLVQADLPFALGPGQRASIRGTVVGSAGSSLFFSLPVFGLNERIPKLRLNEIRVVHSSTRPEAVEVLCLSDGNLGGVVLTRSMPGEADSVFSLPPVVVPPGDMVTLVFRVDPTLIQGPFQGHGHPTPAGAAETGAEIELFAPGGLSDTVEMILLFENGRFESVIDGIFYSNKSWDPEDRYYGYGTRASLEKARYFATLGLYQEFATDPPRPEELVSSKELSSTRTLNRIPDSELGWYVVPNGGNTIGKANSLDRYAP